MKLRVIGLTFAIMALACGSAMANGGTIGIYSDLAGTSCVINAAAYVPTNFYILAKPNVANTNGGVNGAEFRVVGGPSAADAVITPTANPVANVALGNPFEDPAADPNVNPQGCNIAFPDCQIPDGNNTVLLYTVQVVVLNATLADVEMEVMKRNPPTNEIQANFLLISACDPPVFTAVESTGGKGYLNHGSPGECATTVSVESKTWSGVKTLYSN